MKRLLAITLLLTASIAHAETETETYICEPEAQTGLMMPESSYLIVDYSEQKLPDTFVVTWPIWTVIDKPQVLTISKTTGKKEYDCTEIGEMRKGVLECINNWNTIVFRLNTINGKYVKIDNSLSMHADGVEGTTPAPRLEAGSCDLFKP